MDSRIVLAGSISCPAGERDWEQGTVCLPIPFDSGKAIKGGNLLGVQVSTGCCVDFVSYQVNCTMQMRTIIKLPRNFDDIQMMLMKDQRHRGSTTKDESLEQAVNLSASLDS